MNFAQADFRARKVIRVKGGNYIMIKQSVIQEDIIIFNVYVPKSIKICESKSNRTAIETDEFTIIAGDVNTPLSEIDRFNR